MDWDLGHYEVSAPAIEPVAQLVADRITAGPGWTIADIGCGTGNLAVAAAARGAETIGVDPAVRLLDLARARAGDVGLSRVRFVEGRAEELPLPDDSVDAIGSVFGVVFTPDPPAAARELARVLRPGGRIVLTAWLREGVLAAQAELRRELLAAVSDIALPPGLFAWHDSAALTGLFAPYGFEVQVEQRQLAFVGSSPAAYAEQQLDHHPPWVEARELLEPAGRWPDACARVTAAYEAANEDPAAFRVTSRYVVATASAR